MRFIDSFKQFLESMIIPKSDKKAFIWQKQIFQSRNKCWTCDRWFDVGDNKVREHCHITGKYRGSIHWSCNVNLKLTINVSVIFCNFRGYGIKCHLIITEIGKFYVKVNVIPNGLE